jgi:hypothetical protein
MKRINASTLGKAALLCGAGLLMFAVAGASAQSNPQYTAYYAAGGAGIVTILAGFILGAIQLDK